MKAMIYIALIGWIPLSIAFFMTMPRRKAMLATVLGGWLLLPIAGFKLPGLPDYNKSTAIAVAVCLGMLLSRRDEARAWRLSWLDLPILIRCVTPLLSSLSNGLGMYDGLSSTLQELIVTGVPYALGRSTFGSARGMHALVMGFIVAGMLYAPLCLFEGRMSPKLNDWVYGFEQIKSHMTKRLGGYRPKVFLSHGIELGLLMASMTLALTWLWLSGRTHMVLRLRAGTATASMLIVTALTRALNGWAALITCLGVLVASRTARTTIFVLCLALVPTGYVMARALTAWDAEGAIAAVESIDVDRAVSLRSRVTNERAMLEKFRERPWLGWGGWNRNKIETTSVRGKGYVIMDSLWIIELTTHGLVGFISLILALTLPAVLAFRQGMRALWTRREHAAFAVAGIVPLCYVLDGLANYMVTPVYAMSAGAAMSYMQIHRRPQRLLDA